MCLCSEGSGLETDRHGHALIGLNLPILGRGLKSVKRGQGQGRRPEADAGRCLAHNGTAVQPTIGLDDTAHDRRPALTQPWIDPTVRPTDVVAAGAPDKARRRGACAWTGARADTCPLPCPLATKTLARLWRGDRRDAHDQVRLRCLNGRRGQLRWHGSRTGRHMDARGGSGGPTPGLRTGRSWCGDNGRRRHRRAEQQDLKGRRVRFSHNGLGTAQSGQGEQTQVQAGHGHDDAGQKPPVRSQGG